VGSEDFATHYQFYPVQTVFNTRRKTRTFPFPFRMCCDGAMQENTIAFGAGKCNLHMCNFSVHLHLHYDCFTVFYTQLLSILLCVILTYHIITMQSCDHLLNKQNRRHQLHALLISVDD
jgi:hypothetical protein